MAKSQGTAGKRKNRKKKTTESSSGTEGIQTTAAAASPAEESTDAVWTHTDETTLIKYLKIPEVHAQGDKSGNFKITAFNAAAIEVNKVRTEGAPKDGQKVKNKWHRVSAMASWHLDRLLRPTG